MFTGDAVVGMTSSQVENWLNVVIDTKNLPFLHILKKSSSTGYGHIHFSTGEKAEAFLASVTRKGPLNSLNDKSISFCIASKGRNNPWNRYKPARSQPIRDSQYALTEDRETVTIALLIAGPKDVLDVTLENESRVRIIVPPLKLEEITGLRFDHNSLPTEQKREIIIQLPSMVDDSVPVIMKEVVKGIVTITFKKKCGHSVKRVKIQVESAETPI